MSSMISAFFNLVSYERGVWWRESDLRMPDGIKWPLGGNDFLGISRGCEASSEVCSDNEEIFRMHGEIQKVNHIEL
jgi:hypothetical protein